MPIALIVELLSAAAAGITAVVSAIAGARGAIWAWQKIRTAARG